MKFTTSRVFASLALFNQLTVPLFIFPITIPMIISAIISTRRLEQFLSQPEVQKEFEGIKNIARIMSRSASLDVFEIDESDGLTDTAANSSSLSTTTTATTSPSSGYTNDESYDTNPEYYYEKIPYSSKKYERNVQAYNERRSLKGSVKLKKNNQISMNVKLDRNRMRQKSMSREYQFDIANDLAVCIRNGKFTWHKENSSSILTIDKLDIPKGNFHNKFYLNSYSNP